MPATETAAAVLSRREIRALIGGLDGRKPFVDYLEAKVRRLSDLGLGHLEQIGAIRSEHAYWSAVLRHEMRRYDRMRREDGGLDRSYALIHYEFDDLFRYCADPAATFGLDTALPPDVSEIEALVDRIKAFLRTHRSPLPTFDFPLSFPRFFATLYRSVLRIGPGLLRRRSGLDALQPPFWIRVFSTRPAASLEERRAARFWKAVLWSSLIFNLAILAVLVSGILSLSGAARWAAIPFVTLIEIAFVPISTRAILQYARTVVAYRTGRKSGAAALASWKTLRRAMPAIRASLDGPGLEVYDRMVREMAREHLLTPSEFGRLAAFDCSTAPANDQARERLRSWCVKRYVQLNSDRFPLCRPIPPIVSWDDVRSLTVLVFSLNEQFQYRWEELVGTRSDEGPLVESILDKLRRTYRDEWQNLLSELEPTLEPAERVLLHGVQPLGSSVPRKEVQGAVEHWANLRLQTIYCTLEGVRKLRTVYRLLAERFFPEASSKEIDERVTGKLQILLLHDLYPTYPPDSSQKQDMDVYFARHPEAELHWPKDLIHPSKSGAWANVAHRIRGEFLMTLDSDHSIRIEEASSVPHMLREFELDAGLDALQFSLYTFNEKYSWVTRCAGLAGDSWWMQDLRVKSLVGGGGAYGKLVYRVSSILDKELIQPDSVGEDMLTMARLQTADAGIRFIDYVHIGQGEETTFEGIKRKYGRYPIGGLESSLSKLFKEMMLSARPFWHRKVEALYMVSYYPLQVLILFANAVILTGLALNITFSFLYLPILLISAGYFLLLSEGLLSVVDLFERYGRRRGLLRYLALFFPMSVFHTSYMPFYVSQFGKGLKGYARFNVTEKRSALLEGSWEETYRNNASSMQTGSVLLTLALAGLLLHPLSAIGYVAYFPFVYSSAIWTIGPFFFITRRSRVRKVADVVLGLPYVLARAYGDLAKRAFRWRR